MSKKRTLDEIEKKLKDVNTNLSVIGERYITTKTKTRREIQIKNSETGCIFWTQTSRIFSEKPYNYNIIRYDTESIKNIISKITNGEYELVSECSKFNSNILVLHKKCNRTREYRASHFINDGIRCKFCTHESLRKTNEEFDLELSKKSETITRKGDYHNYHSEILLHCTKCNTDFITKPVDIDRQFNEFEELHCPNCDEKYYGEVYTREILSEKSLHFKRQFSDKRCRDKRALRFDFAVFDENMKLDFLIEYDGSQHHDPNSKYARGRFEEIQEHDRIKNKFSKDFNIPLLRITSTSKRKIKEDIERFLDNRK